MKHFSILLIFILLAFPGWAQSTMQQADKEYNSLAYYKAVRLYEDALGTSTLNEGETLSAQAKLAYCYRQLKDTPNSERVFRKMISDYSQDLPAEYVNCYLYYAQALASNGKYKEAQETYEKYNALNSEDRRGTSFSKLYNNVALLTKNAGSYRIERLSINSSAADFSPVYYKDGLVFVSGRDEALAIKRIIFPILKKSRDNPQPHWAGRLILLLRLGEGGKVCWDRMPTPPSRPMIPVRWAFLPGQRTTRVWAMMNVL